MASWINAANLFTLIRLGLVPFIIHAILDGRHGLALALFAAAAVTDVLDGAIARRFSFVTQVGAYLDPIADKCLLSGIFLALAVAGIVPRWFVAIVFGRDIGILLAVAVILLATPVRKFPPSVWGKASTFLQIATAVIWMARNMLGVPVLNALAVGVLYPSAALTVWSGIHYAWRGLRTARVH